MKKLQHSLEPKPSTIQKILMFSKSISPLESTILKNKIVYHTN